MRNTLIVVMSTFFFVTGALVRAQNDCRLPKGLFERRSSLRDDVSSSHDATKRSDDLQLIDEQYFRFIARVQGSARPAESECCKNTSGDPIAELVCKFVAYLRADRKESALLLQSVPTSPREGEALWALDEIVLMHEPSSAEKSARPFGPYGPVTLYLDELYGLVRSGDAEAVSKYLGLYLYSDGDYAEYMDDQLEQLLTEHTDIVLREWSLFKVHPKVLVKLRDVLPRERKKTLRAKLRTGRLCADYSAACTNLSEELLR